MSKIDDQRLIRSLHEGRSEAFSEVVRSHYQAIFRFLVHLSRNIHRAEDLVQETFGNAWERIASFQGRSSMETCLHRIAYTKFIDGQRTKQRAAKLLESMLRLAVRPGQSGSDHMRLVERPDESLQIVSRFQDPRLLMNVETQHFTWPIHQRSPLMVSSKIPDDLLD